MLLHRSGSSMEQPALNDIENCDEYKSDNIASIRSDDINHCIAVVTTICEDREGGKGGTATRLLACTHENGMHRQLAKFQNGIPKLSTVFFESHVERELVGMCGFIRCWH